MRPNLLTSIAVHPKTAGAYVFREERIHSVMQNQVVMDLPDFRTSTRGVCSSALPAYNEEIYHPKTCRFVQEQTYLKYWKCKCQLFLTSKTCKHCPWSTLSSVRSSSYLKCQDSTIINIYILGRSDRGSEKMEIESIWSTCRVI